MVKIVEALGIPYGVVVDYDQVILAYIMSNIACRSLQTPLHS